MQSGVESTDISLDNAMDNLLYANSMNIALLKEAVMNFLAENHREAAANISFSDFPGHVVKDLLIAFSNYVNKDGNEASVDEMSVDALRRKLNIMGVKEVDGSREVMIESIKSASRSSPVFGAPAPAGGAGGLFGGPARAQAPVPAFGFGAPAPAGGLFGPAPPAPAGGPRGLFGAPASN